MMVFAYLVVTDPALRQLDTPPAQLRIAPPPLPPGVSWLLVKTSWFRVKAAKFWIAPPFGDWPPVIVRPEIFTVPESISKTRPARLPLIASWPAPGPVMVKLL